MSVPSILIVEDEAIVAADLAGKLEQLGYQVAGSVDSGEDAVAWAGRHPPDLVLMDIRLSGAMSGIDAARIIQEKYDRPVVFLTAHSDAATLERAKPAGPFGYIIKPFEERDLRITIDLAHHKHVTDRLVREQREWLRVTLGSIGDAVIACDCEGRITFLNAVAERLTGWTSAEVLGQPIRQVFRLIDEETRQPCDDVVARVLREVRPVTLGNHTALITKHGQECPIDDSAAPILDTAGAAIGVVIVFHDVTEKRQAAEALAAAHQRTLNIVESIGDGFFALDADFRMTYINERGAQLLGKPRAELLNRSLWESFPEAVNSGFYRAYHKTLAERVPTTVEEFYPPLNAWFEARAYPAADGLSVFYGNITARKRMEDVLKFLARAGTEQGEDFFKALARYLGVNLGVDYVCIDRLEEGSLTAQTVAVFHDGSFRDNVTYALKDTPCAEVVDRTICCFPAEVRRLFPKDLVLQQMRAESYVGTTLCDSQGRPIGLIALIGRQPLADAELAKSVLQLVAVRAAGELERRQAEEILRQSEEQLRLVLEYSNDGVFWADAATGQIIRCNRKAEELTGRSRDELIGMHQTQLHPDDRDYAEVFRRAAAQTAAENIEVELLSRTGRRIPMLVNSSVVTLGRQRVIQGVFRDITERKRTELALVEARAGLERRVRERTEELLTTMELVKVERKRFQDVLDNLPAYLVLLTPDYRVQFENRFFRERFGPGLSRRCYEYLFQRGEPCESCESFKVLKTQQPHQWEWAGPDGRQYEIHDFPFTDADGSPLVMEVGLDVTERRNAEMEKQNLRNELARVSRITTAGQLAAALAHELNQPLGAIVCNVQAVEHLLGQAAPDLAEVREALKDIEADSKRAGAVIHQLRGLYRKTRPERAELQFNDLLQGTVQLLRSEFVLKGVEVQLELDPQLPPLRGNPIELQQVVLNLVTNAVEAMHACKAGSRRLQIRTLGNEPQTIRATFRDTGAGLTEEQLHRLFEPFYTTKDSGMGMGLPICQSIVESHGGRLWVENNPDQGATFHLLLPVGSDLPT